MLRSTIVVFLLRLVLGVLLLASVGVRVANPTEPSSYPPAAAAWLAALDATRYLVPLLLLAEGLVGRALLSGRFVPLALLIFAPINLNITLFHALLDPQPARLVQILFLALAQLVLVWHNWPAFAPLLRSQPEGDGKFSLWRAGWSPQRVTQTALGTLFVVTGGAKLLGLAEPAGPHGLTKDRTSNNYKCKKLLDVYAEDDGKQRRFNLA